MEKVIIFDFDGTLADSADATLRIYNNIAERNGLAPISRENFAKLRTMSFMDNVRFMKVPLLKLPLIATEVRSAFKKEVPFIKAFGGIGESLRTLKEKGFGLHVVSSNSVENIQAFMDQNKISEFDAIYSVSNLLGKHRKIRSLAAANKWNPSSVMYVGDEVRDIQAAKEAGVKSVAVTWGYNDESILSKNNPDIILRNPSELASL